jgi:zinc protease
MNLREEHGYTYGANSQFPFWRSGGPFSVATGVRNDVTAPAVHRSDERAQRMGETRVTPRADTREGCHHAAAAGAVRVERLHCGSLSTLFTHGLPLNYY